LIECLLWLIKKGITWIAWQPTQRRGLKPQAAAPWHVSPPAGKAALGREAAGWSSSLTPTAAPSFHPTHPTQPSRRPSTHHFSTANPETRKRDKSHTSTNSHRPFTPTRNPTTWITARRPGAVYVPPAPLPAAIDVKLTASSPETTSTAATMPRISRTAAPRQRHNRPSSRAPQSSPSSTKTASSWQPTTWVGPSPPSPPPTPPSLINPPN
jgi:hypothetical protein